MRVPNRVAVVIAAVLTLIVPMTAKAATCGGKPDPSTPNNTYVCVCNKWKLSKETIEVTVCGQKKENYEWHVYDQKTCLYDYFRAIYQEIKADVDDDCSSYTPPVNKCCIADDHWSLVYDPKTGDWVPGNYGNSCAEKKCPKGQLQSLYNKPYGQK